ncbi:GerAB/ArcD/ProY family transporter [Brevibacillus invocatus]|uniref:GerAB/ArcD/ProY family transporter n=1 Tax=Brevibacillus invocatus TaxID=173959 RepID=UPI00203DD17A|nr:GerAB/ArcD/ProY family transporter [Brevibacillus invocatus]MCM3081301.1 spore germination protein [Brevibacillus invocatus]MCM3431629.1 spore germination protein [Brevibacillus invocatus]
MQINVYPKISNQIPAYLLFFLIYSNQVGVGVLGFQRVIAIEAGHDAWISVVIAGMVVHLVMWTIIDTLKRYPSSDLYGITCDVFGQLFGSLINILYMLYFTLIAIVIVRTYTEVIQTWMFPQIPTWLVSASVLGLALYTLLGGIRIITGYTFISVVTTLWLISFLYFPFQYARWSYLYPVLEANVPEILSGAVHMSFTIVGFEILYMVYPFVSNKEKVGAFSQSGALLTNLIYLFLMVLAITFFSKNQLMKTTWATLNLQQMVHLPFLERFEFIILSIWLIVIMPNVMLYTWSVSRGLKRMYQWQYRRTIFVVVLVIFAGVLVFLTRSQINSLNNFASQVGLYAAFIYPILLYIGVVIKGAWRKHRERGNTG